MKGISIAIVFVAGVFFMESVACTKKQDSVNSNTANIVAEAYVPNVPVLKGLNYNAILRLMVNVPSGSPIQTFRKLKCTLNSAALTDVEKIEVFQTAAEAFDTSSKLAAVVPGSTDFEIPVVFNQNPGIKFIWFSVVLKQAASLQNKVELHCTALLDQSNSSVAVNQNGFSYPRYEGVAIRKAGDDGVNTYRIPGIIQTDKGTLIAVYDIRYNNSGDLPNNIDVGMSRSADNGKTWEPMKVIMDMGGPLDNSGIGDPAILFDPITQKIWVAALWSKGNHSIAGSLPGLSPDSTGQFVLVSSADDGKTWSAPNNITSQVKNPAWNIFFQGPGSGIAMQDGKLVFAAQYWDEVKMPYSTIIYSDDHGTSWKGKILGPKSNTTESQVVELSPGKLMLNMRDNRGKYRSVATTSNMGQTWTEHPTSYNALPDPVCMGSLIKTQVNVKGTTKDVLFFSNPNTSSGRYDITIKASLDLGDSWAPVNQILVDERQSYGYSSLTRINADNIGLLYEGIRDLYFVIIPVADILK